MHIPYEDLKLANKPFEGAFLEALRQTMANGRYVLGHAVERFEAAFASYCGAGHCIGVASGLDALRLSLLACQFPPNSEVILPSNAYIAGILAVIQAGLKPVLVEPDMHTRNLDPRLLQEALTPQTVAIMPVHLYGNLCDMPAIMDFAQKHGLIVIEDAAQAHGTHEQGKKAGAWGHLGAFSFYPTKNLGALGDGGAIVTNSASLAERLRMLRNYGFAKKDEAKLQGYNSRLDELQAAFLLAKLPFLDAINEHKRKLAAIYQQYIALPGHSSGHNYHICCIHHERRDGLKAHLASMGIGTGIHYPIPPHRQEALAPLFTGRAFPISEYLHRTALSLPISSIHTTAQIEEIAQHIAIWLSKNHE